MQQQLLDIPAHSPPAEPPLHIGTRLFLVKPGLVWIEAEAFALEEDVPF
jgi:hypothetical protein